MNRIAAMTVIRGDGECQTLMNGVIQKDIERLNVEHNKELEDLKFRLETVTKNRDRLQANVINDINEMVEEHVKVIDKIRDGIEYAWCMMWGMILSYFIEEIFDEEDK